MTHLYSPATFVLTVLFAGVFALTPAPLASAQDYWEYDQWEGEWEHHYPTRGIEVEHEDDGDIDIEAEQYEWDAEYGYHEQEWYDPSDWFSMGRDFEVEDDGMNTGYDYYYTDDWYDEDSTFYRWYWW